MEIVKLTSRTVPGLVYIGIRIPTYDKGEWIAITDVIKNEIPQRVHFISPNEFTMEFLTIL